MKLLATSLTLCLVFAAWVALPTWRRQRKTPSPWPNGAQRLLKANGKEEMMKQITATDPDFVQGSLYVDLRDIQTCIVLAHPSPPPSLGKDLTDVPDANGKKYRREIIELADPVRERAGSTTSTRSDHRQDRSRRPPTSCGSTMCRWRPAWYKK